MFKRNPTRPSPLRYWTAKRLRWVLGLSLLLLAIPTAVLSLKARQQIKWEALYQHRLQAEELSQRIDNQLQSWIAREQQRPIADYQFLINSGSTIQPGYQQRSPLSNPPSSESIPGLIGYFQIDHQGQLQTPLLPKQSNDALRWGVSPNQLQQRLAVSQTLYSILRENKLVEKRAAATATPLTANITDADDYQSAGQSSAEQKSQAPLQAQANFDRLAEAESAPAPRQSLGKIAELKLEKQFAYDEAPRAKKSKPAPVKESLSQALASAPAPAPVTLFEQQAAAFELALLNSGHLVLFRKIWHNNQRAVQGLLLDQTAFLGGLFQAPFQQSPLASLSDLVIAYRGDVLQIIAQSYPSSQSPSQLQSRTLDFNAYSARDVRGTLLLQQKMSNPLADLELIYSANRLPDGPGGTVITWASIVLLLLLMGVFGLLYRLGLRQIHLAQQQQNFIASVSHELKTPLTSIRMFSEILKEGWVSEQKQQEYYHYISDESERLSRLITNVLQLARMERQELQLDIKPISLLTLQDLIRSRIQSQVERSGFRVVFDFALDDNSQQQAPTLDIDPDALMQILLNLVDNSIKFCADADQKQIDVSVQVQDKNMVIRVRDYGPGIPEQQLHHIFTLFYRVGNELTRNTQGTGIGLALVQQLTQSMHGQISVANQQPGVCFSIRFPI